MSILSSSSYVSYLTARMPKRGSERGARSKLASFLGCQTSFISQVLSSRAHLSLEQSIRVATFLGLYSNERDYFLLMVQRDRAGSKELKNHFESKLSSKRRTLESVSVQVGKAKNLEEDIAAHYYSSWTYSACHILCALPKLSKKEALRKYLGISKQRFEQCLKFLEDAKFIEVNGQELNILQHRVHIADDSSHVSRHHVNWRLRAISQIDKAEHDDLHFSALYGISETDAQKIKSILLDAIKDSEKVVGPSKEESPFVLLMDFYRLGSVE